MGPSYQNTLDRPFFPQNNGRFPTTVARPLGALPVWLRELWIPDGKQTNHAMARARMESLDGPNTTETRPRGRIMHPPRKPNCTVFEETGVMGTYSQDPPILSFHSLLRRCLPSRPRSSPLVPSQRGAWEAGQRAERRGSPGSCRQAPHALRWLGPRGRGALGPKQSPAGM